ncbi:MAG: hypothetical protein LAT67_13965 [Balneolales bacterium]|nr:hypothetical protein [Balneolales bacterium]
MVRISEFGRLHFSICDWVLSSEFAQINANFKLRSHFLECITDGWMDGWMDGLTD